jgi:DNA topoisomerase-1
MATLLKEMTAKGTIPEKVKAYNDANRRVAILCNHKRTVGAGHAVQMEKMEDRINALRYQQWRIKQMMLAEEPKLKKKKGAEYFALPSDLAQEWIHTHHDSLVEAEKVKITKKFEKENEKLESEGSKPMKDKELKERLEAATEMEKKFKAERKSGKVLPEGRSPSVEKYEKDLEKLDTRIATLQLQSEDRENNKEVALGTSKIVSFLLLLLHTNRIEILILLFSFLAAELHRSPPHRRLLEEIRRPHRALLLQDAAGEIRMGYQVGR